MFTDKFKIDRDDRGVIIHLLENTPINSILLIESRRGSIRANHWHKKDSHYCYFLKGSARYYYREVGDTGEPKSRIVRKGETVYTPPAVEHAMEFLEDSTFLAFTQIDRSQSNYEEDIVRVSLI